MAVNAEKEKAIELAMSAVEKQFGKGSIMRLGNEEPLIRDVQVIPTGAISLDIALGVGGVPKGRIIEIYGPESSGKTTLCLHIAAEAQKKGGICGYIDAEHAMDVGYARKLGVRTDDLLLSQPDTGEQGLEIAEMLVRSGAVDVLVIDSVAALVPKAELEGEMERAQVLCVAATGHSAHRCHQERRASHRQPDTRQSRQEQGCAAVQRSRVRHHVRNGHLQRG
jgi:recombination protein RecA